MPFSVAIVGGGLVGAAAALSLSKQGYLVTLIERQAPSIQTGRLGVDIRNVALNPQSRQFIESLDCWPVDAAVEYSDMSVWEERGSAQLTFSAPELRQSQLGWIVPSSALQVMLWEQCLAQVNAGHMHLIEAPLVAANIDSEGITLTLEDGTMQAFDFAIAADGARSLLRQLIGSKVEEFPVAQQALATVIETERGHEHRAHQKFLSDGPLAFLPAQSVDDKHLVSVVWSQSASEAERRMALDDDEFCAELSRLSEQCLGRVLATDKRFIFGLTQQVISTATVKTRLAFIGDAARVVHPLAGLGVNLGYEDLLDLLTVTQHGQGLASAGPLRAYARRRRARSLQVIWLLGMLKSIYGSTDPAIGLLRNVGVGMLNRMGGVKHQVMKEAMGLGPLSAVAK